MTKINFTQTSFSLLFLLWGTQVESTTNLDDLTELEREKILTENVYTDPAFIKSHYQTTKDVTEILEKHGMKYWAMAGTVLGAVRHSVNNGSFAGGLPKWDDDTDYGIHIEDAGKFFPLPKDRNGLSFSKDFEVTPLQKELRQHGYAIADHPQMGYHIYSIQKVKLASGVEKSNTVDIFFYETELDQKSGEERLMLSLPGARKMFSRLWFEPSEVETLIRLDYGGYQIFGPSDPKTHLTRAYGPNWSEQAVCHFTHSKGSLGTKYVWTLSDGHLKPAFYEGVLEDRVVDFVMHGEEG